MGKVWSTWTSRVSKASVPFEAVARWCCRWLQLYRNLHMHGFCTLKSHKLNKEKGGGKPSLELTVHTWNTLKLWDWKIDEFSFLSFGACWQVWRGLVVGSEKSWRPHFQNAGMKHISCLVDFSVWRLGNRVDFWWFLFWAEKSGKLWWELRK